MILSMLLTMVFGFGVITLATIALLNVAGLRIHDLREVKRDDESVFAYAYVSKEAYDLRESVGKLPRWLTWGAIRRCVVYDDTDGNLRLVAGFPIGVQEAVDSQKTMDHLEPIDIIVWVPITGYVAVLLWLAGSISRRCYVVLKEIEHRQPVGSSRGYICPKTLAFKQPLVEQMTSH